MRTATCLVLLAALAPPPCLAADPAAPMAHRYYGVVSGGGLRFGCTPARYVGKAYVEITASELIGFLADGFTVSDINHLHVLNISKEPPVPGTGADFSIGGNWVTNGGVVGRTWNIEAPGPLAGYGTDSLLTLPAPGAPACAYGGTIYLRGTGQMRELTVVGNSGTEKHCPLDWVFQGQERDEPPRPPNGRWARDPTNLWLQLQAALGTKFCAKQGKAAPTTVAVTPCAPSTLCFATSKSSAPELIVRSRPMAGGQVAVSYLPLGVNATEVWSLPAGTAAEGARSWVIPPAPPTGVERVGLIDLAGYRRPATGGIEQEGPGDVAELHAEWDDSEWDDTEQDDAALDAQALPTWEEELLHGELQAAAPAPPSGAWIDTPALPGYRFKARLAGAPLVRSAACPKQTLCLGNTPSVPAQLFARVTARQSNGKRWVLAGKLPDGAAELWVQQGTTGPVRYYALAQRPAGSPWLAAIADRLAFGG